MALIVRRRPRTRRAKGPAPRRLLAGAGTVATSATVNSAHLRCRLGGSRGRLMIVAGRSLRRRGRRRSTVGRAAADRADLGHWLEVAEQWTPARGFWRKKRATHFVGRGLGGVFSLSGLQLPLAQWRPSTGQINEMETRRENQLGAAVERAAHLHGNSAHCNRSRSQLSAGKRMESRPRNI